MCPFTVAVSTCSMVWESMECERGEVYLASVDVLATFVNFEPSIVPV